MSHASATQKPRPQTAQSSASPREAPPGRAVQRAQKCVSQAPQAAPSLPLHALQLRAPQAPQGAPLLPAQPAQKKRRQLLQRSPSPPAQLAHTCAEQTQHLPLPAAPSRHAGRAQKPSPHSGHAARSQREQKGSSHTAHGRPPLPSWPAQGTAPHTPQLRVDEDEDEDEEDGGACAKLAEQRTQKRPHPAPGQGLPALPSQRRQKRSSQTEQGSPPPPTQSRQHGCSHETQVRPSATKVGAHRAQTARSQTPQGSTHGPQIGALQDSHAHTASRSHSCAHA